MKINKKQTIKQEIENHPDIVENYEGGIAFKMDDMTRLYTRVASCLIGEPKFYKNINEDGKITSKNQDNDLISDIHTVSKTDPEFILQLASYTRNVLNLRTVSIVLLAEASLIDECKPFVRRYTQKIVKRADELAEVVAYIQKKIGDLGNKKDKGSLPSAIKKGLAYTFNNFNEYQLAKYNRKGFVKLKDVLKLVHPKPKDSKQSEIFKKLKEDKLEIPDTWEVNISTKGSTKENWEESYKSMGIMAVIRNLRNFLEKKVSEDTINDIYNTLSDKDVIMKSRQLPFRFFSAYRELESTSSIYTSKILDALENSMDISVDNLPRLKGLTFITSDNSGSMTSQLSGKSKVTYRDIANLMLSISHKMCENSITSVFGDRFKAFNISSRNGVLNNLNEVNRVGNTVGHSTNAYLSLDYLISEKIKVDRIIILSDMQCYDSRGWGCGSSSVAEKLKVYKRTVNPNVFVYSVDLAGYGTAQIPKDETNVCKIAGWSERILEYIKLFEEDKKSSINRIKEYNK